MTIPFFDATRQYAKIERSVSMAVKKVFESGKFVLGQECELFEHLFAKDMGVKFGVGLNSGTDAIKIALRSMGIGQGDEVITVANTAVPTISAIRETGAVPVFVDIDEYFTIDTKKIKSAITKNTRAIMPVHLYGHPCDMPEVMQIAKENGLRVIEDCAQATGAMIKNKKVGTFGDIGCFSFYPTKNLGAYGDGGLLATSDSHLANSARQIRMYGMANGIYYAHREGYNSRLDEIQAAILRIKLKHLEKWNTRRKKIAAFYLKNINNAHVYLPVMRPTFSHVFHLFVIRSPYRDALKKYLEASGIGCGIHYPFPIHLQDAYAFLDYRAGDLPLTEKAAEEALSIPIFPELTREELVYIVKKINCFKP